MCKRETDFNLEQLLSFITLSSKSTAQNASSFESPSISLITNEIGIIFLTTVNKEEKTTAENKLIELLENCLNSVRQIAYFFISKYETLAPCDLSKNSQKVLREFEENPKNIEIIKNARAAI